MTYQEVIRDAKKLAETIKLVEENYRNNYRFIHPIPSGGIAIGVIVAEILNLPLLSIGEYKDHLNKEEILVVDDLVDSGKTLLRYPDSDTAVLYKKIHCQIQPTYYLKEIGSEWVTFPHEKDKDGILDHVIRVCSFVNIQLTEEQEEKVINLLNKIKQ